MEGLGCFRVIKRHKEGVNEERPAGEVVAKSPVVDFDIAPSVHRRRADLVVGFRAED